MHPINSRWIYVLIKIANTLKKHYPCCNSGTLAAAEVTPEFSYNASRFIKKTNSREINSSSGKKYRSRNWLTLK